MKTESLSKTFARYIHDLSIHELPREVVERAKDRVLDALALAIAGRNSPYYRIGATLVGDDPGKATVFFQGRKLRAVDAAFLNALMIDTIGATDTLGFAHPGGPIIPTALALGEEEGRSGADVLAAIVAGYDIMTRVWLGKESITPRFRGLSVFGPFGAAAAAGKVLKLNEDQLKNALGYAANLASGLTECWLAGTTEAKFHAGLATRNGITAALLARAGAETAESTFEGKAGFYQAFGGGTDGVEKAVADLGKRFLIMETHYKPYPVCAENQVAVAVALKLKKAHAIDGKEIAAITEVGPHLSISYPGVNNPGPFKTRLQATMSAQFCNAAVFLTDSVASFEFFDKNYSNSEIGELAKKVKLVGEKDRHSTVTEVTLKDGRKYRLEGDKNELVPSFEKIKIKFQNLAAGFLSKDKVEKLIELVSNLDKANSVKGLTDELIDRGDAA
jgi:2-methylcitrate dehydratase PrpD